ncbi:glycosyltransferase family 2 protein [Rathayibacter sp. KR2-224]|uniref:glycosyltransferase family 2 protein n=1 Tax=Rathayibacter sp. KR2-224 TaxID=3400913 RepID=UPI003C00E05C
MVAVVVAYNRTALLEECLRAILAQTVAPDAIVVVDNASTDDSAATARSIVPGVHVLSLPRNTGGAGGFAVGIAEAVENHDADYVWVMDDDTVPTSTALQELVRVVEVSPHNTNLVGSRVEWIDGRPHPMNTPRVRPFASRRSVARAAKYQCYPVRSASFVSLLIKGSAVRSLGLPIVDYFLWNDDFEYSARLLRYGRGYLACRSVVVHKTRQFGSTDADPGARFLFEVRNKIWMLAHSRSLSVGEKAIYLVSTLLRWLRTFVRSHDRAVLRRGLVDGLRQGIKTRPAPNSVALDAYGVRADAVERLESRAKSAL